MASSKTDVTSERAGLSTEHFHLYNTDPTHPCSWAPWLPPHSSQFPHALFPVGFLQCPASRNIGFRDLVEFKYDEFSPSICSKCKHSYKSDFQKHPGKLKDLVIHNLHLLSWKSLPCHISPLFQGKFFLQRRQLIWASAKDDAEMCCCHDGGYQLLTCTEAAYNVKRKRSIAGKQWAWGLRHWVSGQLLLPQHQHILSETSA